MWLLTHEMVGPLNLVVFGKKAFYRQGLDKRASATQPQRN